MAQQYFTGYQGNFNPTLAASIASGQTTSGVIPLSGFVLCGIQFPAAFTGVSISFLVSSSSSGPFGILRTGTAGAAIVYTVTQGDYSAIDPKDFYGVSFLKIVSASTEGATRALTLSVRGF